MRFLSAVLLLFVSLGWAQPQLEMTPRGFAPIELPSPNKPNEKLMEAVEAWVPYYNKKGHDIYDLTTSSASIDAFKEYAYFYYNTGDRYDCNIVYTLKVVFNPNKTYTLTFSVKEIYAKQTLTKTTVADFFTPDGKLKDDFADVKPSLEKTANRIVKSFAEFIAN
ncbi:hypothetical protein [Flavobacterium sp.]|uniref:hypothetical protein n=1 Tax=Flavobacterium sp. TaxID=239 RepID=UPI0039E356B6